MRIFISHSARDVDLATAFVGLLRAATTLLPVDIRCSSVDGFRLPGGATTSEVLRREVHESEVLIGLITPASVASSYVLFELGARWGADRTLVPLLARGAEPVLLPGPLRERNALNATAPAQVYQVLQEITDLLGIHLVSPAAYQSALATVVELASQPDLTAVNTAAGAPVTPKPQRLRAAFISGSGLGERIILLPMDATDLGGLREFVAACRLLGVVGDTISFLEAYLDDPHDFQETGSREVGRNVIQAFLDKLSLIENDLPSLMSGMELGWFKLGYQLSQVAALYLYYAQEDLHQDDHDNSIEGPLLALRSTIEMLDGPPTIIAALNELVERAESGEEATSLYRGYQAIAQAIHSLLDVLVRQQT